MMMQHADITEMEMVSLINGRTVAERLVEMLKARSVDAVGDRDQRVQGSAADEELNQMLPYIKLAALKLAISLLTHHGGIFKTDFRHSDFGGAVRHLSVSELFKSEPLAIVGIAHSDFGGAVRHLSVSELFKSEPLAIVGIASHPVIMSVDPHAAAFESLVKNALTAVEAE